MEKVDITLTFDAGKLDALAFSLRKQNTTVQSRMDEALKQLYEKTVPEPAREYLDSKDAPAPKPRRPAKPPKPQAAAQKSSPSAIAPPVPNSGKTGE